jgi:Spy/CpxP family protein refolding chaperone
MMNMNLRYMNWKNIFRGLILWAFLLVAATDAFAQRGGGRELPGREKLESARVALITQRLNLDPETAQRFWPIYNQVREEEEAMRREEMQMRRATRPGQLSDAEAQQKLDQYFALKERQLELKQEAANRYREVLSARQVLQLLKAESDFRRMVLEKMSERSRRDRN